MKRRNLLIGSAGLSIAPVTTSLGAIPCPPGADEQTCDGRAVLPIGHLSQDASIPEQLPLYLPVTGAISQDAVAGVEYRVAGSGNYASAAPLWRIQPQYSDRNVADAFAGTIFDLRPGLSYDVRVTVTEPGVGADTKTQTFTTRALPLNAGSATAVVSNESTLLSAINTASPGDVIEFSGTIALSGRIDIDGVSGTSNNPIYLRGTDRDSSILSSPGSILRLLSADNWVVENCTLSGPGTDTGTNASNIGVNCWDENVSGWTFRNVRIDGVDMGIMGDGRQSGMLIYDCILEGNNTWTQNNLESNATWNDDGIRIGGIGNAVFNNTVSNFGDALSFRQQSATHSVIGCFYYRNKVLRSGDDAIEAEYTERNCGTYDNYTMNSMTMISIDGIYGGPYYHFRNRHINCGRTIIKNGAPATGVLFWHNTFVQTETTTISGGGLSPGFYWSAAAIVRDWVYQNNLYMFEGSRRGLWLEASAQDPAVITNNAWGRNRRSMIWDGNGIGEGSPDQVNSSLSPLFDNDIDIANQAAVFGTPVTLGATFLTEVTTEYDLALKAGAQAIGRARYIPNISPTNDIGAVGFGIAPAVVGHRT